MVAGCARRWPVERRRCGLSSWLLGCFCAAHRAAQICAASFARVGIQLSGSLCSDLHHAFFQLTIVARCFSPNATIGGSHIFRSASFASSTHHLIGVKGMRDASILRAERRIADLSQRTSPISWLRTLVPVFSDASLRAVQPAGQSGPQRAQLSNPPDGKLLRSVVLTTKRLLSGLRLGFFVRIRRLCSSLQMHSCFVHLPGDSGYLFDDSFTKTSLSSRCFEKSHKLYVSD